MEKRIVGVNARGWRVGQDHHGAKLTDAEVELIRELRDEGWTYACLAEKFETSKDTIAAICTYRRRGEMPVRFKAVCVNV